MLVCAGLQAVAVAGGERGADPAGPEQDPASLPPHQRARWARLVEAAGDLLDSADYDAIQVRDVAGRAGMALGTVYRYFPSKEQLYAVVLREWSARDEGTYAAPADPAGPPGERLRARLHHSIDQFEANPTYLRLQIFLQQSADPVVRRVFDQFSVQVVESYRARIDDLPAKDRDDVVVMASGLLVHQLGLFAQGRQPVGEVRRLIDRFVDAVFDGGIRAGVPSASVNASHVDGLGGGAE